MAIGIIMKGIGGFYYIKKENEIYECRARGLFRKNSQSPIPGDKIIFDIVDEEKKIGYINEILERSSELIRPKIANVNQIAVIISVEAPVTDMMLLDKILITSQKKGLKIILCINKIDLDLNKSYEKIMNIYLKIGYKIILLSSKTDYGFDELIETLKEKITVLAGQSGVGKSTILNRIMNSYVMETGVLSKRTDRGKHTTRHAELIELKCKGFIVDTPGFSAFELEDINYQELQYCYPEFEKLINLCKFTGCSHIKEIGCSVKKALEMKEIDQERYERYTNIYNVLKSINPYK